MNFAQIIAQPGTGFTGCQMRFRVSIAIRLLRVSFVSIAGLLAQTQSSFAAIPLSTGSAYVQDFDVMGTSAAATLPTDFRADKQVVVRTLGTYGSAVTATERVGAANISTVAGNGIYNFGAGTTSVGGTDRSLGFLSSSGGTFSGNVYAHFFNGTGGDLTGLEISYDVEKYRDGQNPLGFSVQMYYSFDGVNWTSAGHRFLTSFPADADNNGFATAPGATNQVVNQILVITIPNGADLYLAWNYSVSASTTTTNGQALGLDNVSVLAIASPIPPFVTVEPQNTNTCVGNDVSFFVEADGTQSLQFNWIRNGFPVSSGVVTSTPTNSTLTLTNVQLFDSGADIFVHVSSIYGSHSSTNVFLYVSDVPSITQQPTNPPAPIPVSGTIMFSVVASPSPLSYQWWFQGQPLTNDARITGADAANLRISNAQISDAGYYRAVISNYCLKLDSVSVRCDMGSPPQITNQPVSQLAPFKATVKYSVGAFGPPVLTYQWYRNDVPIGGAVSSDLNLALVQRPNVGVYHAVVANASGAVASDRAQLQIELTQDGTVIAREEATDFLLSLTNALRTSITQPTIIFHGVPVLFTTYDATRDDFETNHCNIPASHTMWLLYYSPRAEVTKVTTEGSDFDTVVAVYTWNGNTNNLPTPVQCDNNGGYDRRTSLLYFQSQADKDYYIAVDGVGGATGTARVQVGDIIRRARFTPQDGKFLFEMAGPYWLTTTLRSSTSSAQAVSAWPVLMTIPTSSQDWLVRYTNSTPLSDVIRLYQAAAQ